MIAQRYAVAAAHVPAHDGKNRRKAIAMSHILVLVGQP
jgi:hypothetical protein